MKPNRGREPSPVTTFDANALRLAESSFLCVFADECRGSAAAPIRRLLARRTSAAPVPCQNSRTVSELVFSAILRLLCGTR
jgi:hypothetical protein